jgi:hypothetical protein
MPLVFWKAAISIRGAGHRFLWGGFGVGSVELGSVRADTIIEMNVVAVITTKKGVGDRSIDPQHLGQRRDALVTYHFGA